MSFLLAYRHVPALTGERNYAWGRRFWRFRSYWSSRCREANRIPGRSAFSFLCSTTEVCHFAAGYSACEAVPSVWSRPATSGSVVTPKPRCPRCRDQLSDREANLLQYLLHLQNLLPQRSCFHAHERRKMLIRSPFPYVVQRIGVSGRAPTRVRPPVAGSTAAGGPALQFRLICVRAGACASSAETQSLRADAGVRKSRRQSARARDQSLNARKSHTF